MSATAPLSFALALVLAAGLAPVFAAPVATGTSVTVVSDVPYLGTDRSEKMDVYLPPAHFTRPLAAVLLIHGGGWRIGDKAAGRERGNALLLAAEGYAVCSINYALNQSAVDAKKQVKLNGIAWPQNFYDCKSALRFMRTHAADYGIDSTRIAAMGGSAGAHLAMLVGATKDAAELNRGGLHTEASNDVACVIDFYGVADVQDPSLAKSFAGATSAETAANAKAASPATYFTKHSPPLLIIHGTKDTSVPVEVSQKLFAQTRALGIESSYIEIPGAEHGFGIRSDLKDLGPEIFAFLNKHLGNHP